MPGVDDLEKPGVIDTDYLVIGAGASGMAFTDALIQESDAEVVMVDRQHRPGGHWNHAYPFVRLHQPSASYGVNSRALGTESIDTTGPNAGFYERATAVEICDYYRGVLEDHLLPSGKVRFLGGCDYVENGSNGHAITSRLTGKTTTVRVRRKVVDGTYLASSVPATHTPGFTVASDAQLIPVGDLVAVSEPPSGYTILGAGKTAMDACNWLLDNGVDPDRIRWIKPRDAWLWDRASLQPLDLIVSTMERLSHGIEALAEAEDVDDFFRRFEACGLLFRLDPTVEPTMFRGAIVSRAEGESLRQIERIVRLGRVVHLGADRIELEDGAIPTDRGEIHVDCTAYGFRAAPARPIFEPGRITVQTLSGGFTAFNAALVGFVESVRDDDAEKNRLCPPVSQPSQPIDLVPGVCGFLRYFATHSAEPDLMAWSAGSRLALTRGLTEHMEDPRMQSAMARWIANLEPAVENEEQLLAGSASSNPLSAAADRQRA
ncbi:MAG: NAD(P)-binding protein [Actinomycetota bacterium]|nr:NAD(P)-binding protein [Actinomycetota bacterium]